MTRERMPLASRIIFTFLGIALPVGAHVADYGKSHIFNPSWPPHAKFHCGQTLMMSIMLGLLTIGFAWRKTMDRSAIWATAGFAVVYWTSQGMAICYPGTAFSDPQFVDESRVIAGLPVQAYIEALGITLTVIATWLSLRKRPAVA